MVQFWAQHIYQRHCNPPHSQLPAGLAVNSVTSQALRAEVLCTVWPPYHPQHTSLDGTTVLQDGCHRSAHPMAHHTDQSRRVPPLSALVGPFSIK